MFPIDQIKSYIHRSSITGLKGVIYFLSIGIISLYEAVLFYERSWGFMEVLRDWGIALIIMTVIIEFSFYLIKNKERELQEKIFQVADAYEYIGIANRKLEKLLDIKNPLYERDDVSPHEFKEKTEELLRNLMILTNIHSALFASTDTAMHKTRVQIVDPQQETHEITQLLNRLSKMGIAEYTNSDNPTDRALFIANGIPHSVLVKYSLIIKPVYLQSKDLGMLYLISERRSELNDIDIKIIRLFSFYLALLHYSPQQLRIS